MHTKYIVVQDLSKNMNLIKNEVLSLDMLIPETALTVL